MNSEKNELGKTSNLKTGFWNKLDKMTRIFLIVMIILIIGIFVYNIFYSDYLKKTFA